MRLPRRNAAVLDSCRCGCRRAGWRPSSARRCGGKTLPFAAPAPSFTASHCGSAAARKTKSKAEEEALRRGSREGISEAPDQASRGGKEKARGQRKTGKEKTGKEKPTDPNALRWFVILLEIHLLIIFMGLSREKIGRSKRSGRKAPGDQTTGACPRPRRAGAHKKSVPRGAPMQLLAPRRNPECSNGHFNTLE